MKFEKKDEKYYVGFIFKKRRELKDLPKYFRKSDPYDYIEQHAYQKMGESCAEYREGLQGSFSFTNKDKSLEFYLWAFQTRLLRKVTYTTQTLLDEKAEREEKELILKTTST